MTQITNDTGLIQTVQDYQSILGIHFTGIYSGNWTLERSGKTELYSVISLQFDPREISPVLMSIVTADHAHRIWTGMTGPRTEYPQSEYQLWSPAPIKDAKPGRKQTYRIMGVACFLDDVTLGNHTYNGGVELQIETCND